MGKLINAIKNIGRKVNGKEPDGKSLTEVLNGIADDYNIEVTDIKALTTAQCEALQCGGVVIKVTGNQKHRYVVSYKEDKVGMCLTYTDASLVETVSYDYTEGNWVYNSTDSTSLVD